MISLQSKGGTRASECMECSEKFLFLYEIFQTDSNNQTKKRKKNRRLFPIHSHFRKYCPLHFMKKAGAALVKTITSIDSVFT